MKSAVAWDDIHHLIIIIPNYNERLDILTRTLNQLRQQEGAKDRMSIILAMEGGEPNSYRKAQFLQRHFAPHFANLYYTVHPRGLIGEMQCKSANLAWAAKVVSGQGRGRGWRRHRQCHRHDDGRGHALACQSLRLPQLSFRAEQKTGIARFGKRRSVTTATSGR